MSVIGALRGQVSAQGSGGSSYRYGASLSHRSRTEVKRWVRVPNVGAERPRTGGSGYSLRAPLRSSFTGPESSSKGDRGGKGEAGRWCRRRRATGEGADAPTPAAHPDHAPRRGGESQRAGEGAR